MPAATQNWLDIPVSHLPKHEASDELMRLAASALVAAMRLAQPYSEMLCDTLVIKHDDSGESAGYTSRSFLVCQSSVPTPTQVRCDGHRFVIARVVQYGYGLYTSVDLDRLLDDTPTAVTKATLVRSLLSTSFIPTITLRDLADGLRNLVARVRRIQAQAQPAIEELAWLLQQD